MTAITPADWFDGLHFPRWLVQHPDLTWSDRALYAMLAKHSSGNGVANPRIETLTAEIGLSKRAIIYSVKKLISAGLLDKTRLGQGKANRYTVKLPTEGVSRAPREVHSVHFPTNRTVTEELTTPPNHPECDSEGGSPPSRESHRSDSIEGKTGGGGGSPPGFDLFWGEYPRKVGKAAAMKAWKRLLKSKDRSSFGEILSGLGRYKRLWAGKDAQYIPHASTWLNGRRWEDDLSGELPEQKASPFSGMPNIDDLMKGEDNGD